MGNVLCFPARHDRMVELVERMMTAEDYGEDA